MNQYCSVLTVTNRDNYLKNIIRNYNCQDYQNKELVVVLNNNSLSIDAYQDYIGCRDDIKIISCDESKTLGECKNIGITHCSHDYIAFFDDDDYYGEKFLSDSLAVFDRKRCGIVGKKSFYIFLESNNTLAICLPSNENRFVYHIADSSMIVKREVVEKVKFPSIKGSGTITTFQSKCISMGFRIYSTNKHHYVAHRHPDPDRTHTWTINEKDLLKHCRIVQKDIEDYTPLVNI